MPARILSLPFVLAALVFLYLTWEVDTRYSLYIVPPVIILALIFTLSPQINWWWYQRYPPDVKGKLRMLLERQLPYYQQMSPEEQQRFRHRVALYMEANDFMAKGMDEVSADLKAVAAICAVQLTFGRRDFLLSKFEHLIFFPMPFPSPQYPESYHASEIYTEDGAILFSAEQLMKSFFSPQQYYHIGLHEYAKVFMHSHPELPFPKLPEAHWEELQLISGFSREHIEQWINLKSIPLSAVSLTLFFTHSAAFYQQQPELFEQYARLLNQSPLKPDSPVLGPLEASGS